MRRTFGIFTLLALTISFGELVWASTCVPMSESSGLTEAVAELVPPGSADGSQASGCAFMAHPDQGDGDPCPLTPAATQGCTAAASFPAAEAQVVISSPVIGLATAPDRIRYTLLLARPPFHPPRA